MNRQSQCEDDSNSDVILYDKFEKMMVRVMMENEITRDSEERIVQAFKTIAKGKHSINMEELAVYLTTMGDKFTQEELEEFKSASMDPDKGEILYEDYASVLASDERL
eukprot:TRINITY_DN1219_c0_g1_i5.p1 TRINITY_DN1219_c0_g1~~TRINITY_DN1219_c0_g1_i5.p1  ORF type:complete len:108 (-),score=22.95 TRINITY_DN1219_c0_g1_i5:129-452(-)